MARIKQMSNIKSNVNAYGIANAYTNAYGIANAYKLALCEVFHPMLHGQDENSSPNINSQFLVYTIIDTAEFQDGSYVSEEMHLKRYVAALQKLHGLELEKHPMLRNYAKAAQKYSRLEIIQADILSPGQEEVATLKTFWLRIVQRRWKKIYKARKMLLSERGELKAIQERQRTGKWPAHLRQWPLFKLFD
jgi:hypothetical protein